MPIFGQVWLWSLLAFLLGTGFCWLLLVLPIRKRIYALERRLATMRAETKTAPAAPERRVEPAAAPPPPSQPSIVPGFGESDEQDEIRAESLTRAYAMPGLLDTPPVEEAEERGALRISGEPEPPADVTGYLGTQGAPLVPPPPRQPAEPMSPASSQGWFEDEVEPEPILPSPRADHHLVDDDDEDRGTIFTQRTTPIPAELIRELDEASKAPEPPAGPKDDSLVDDLEDEPEEPPAAAPEPAFSGADTVIVHKNGALPTELAPAPEPEPEPMPMPEPKKRVSEPAVTERPEERVPVAANNKNTMRAPIIELNKPLELDRTQSVLPKRVPSKPQHRAPFGVQTTSPAITTPAIATTDTGAERMRSLFEPIIPAESSQQNDVLPPPHRLHSADSSRPSTPGPFGPGSAMPLPGGASPSPEFTVKASVTALRYCTPESPQFGKTVAEVWFRSAADAERVGFRPVG
jgi:hypothetical protein